MNTGLLNQITACLNRKKVEEIASQTGFQKRHRKINPYKFLLSLVTGAAGKNKASIGSHISSVKISVSKVAFSRRINSSAAANFMHCILKLVTLNQPHNGQKKIAGLDQFKAIKLFDSSQISLSKRVKDIYCGRGDKAMCKIQIVYNIMKEEVELCDITSAKIPDQKYARECPAFIDEGDLAIFDLGYFSTNALFKAIIEKGAFFLTKFNWQTNAYDPVTGQKIDLKKTASRLPVGCTQSVDIFLSRAKSGDKVHCRLIITRLPEDLAIKKRKNLYKASRGRGTSPSADSLFWCNYFLLLTNVPETMLPSVVLVECYTVRWQIELLFKIFKSVLKMDTVTSTNENRLRCEICGRMIVAIIAARMHAAFAIPSWNNHRQIISLHTFIQRFTDNAQEFTNKLISGLAKARRWLYRQLSLWIKTSISPPRKKHPHTVEKITKSMEANEYLLEKIA